MKSILVTGMAATIAAGVVVAGAMGGSAPQTMPAKDPTVSSQPSIQKAVPGKRLAGKASSYFYMSNGGGKVTITKMVTKGYTGSQTVTITPPSGSQIVQGFATISGGQLGAMVIRSTQSTATTYKINLAYPGEQGTPGQLTFRIQLGDR